MKKCIGLLGLLILLSSCTEKETSPLDGIWITSYTKLGKKQKFPSFSRNLLEFKDSTVLITAIGDMSSSKFDETTQRTLKFQLQDSLFNFAGDQYIIKFGDDSLYLKPIGSKNTLIVFKRLAESLQNPKFSRSDFQGKFSWLGENQKLDFSNDSIILPEKQMEGIHLPAVKWNIIEYKGYHFFNIHDELFGLAFIKSTDENNIFLLKNYIGFKDIHLEKENTEAQYKTMDFLGKWKSSNLRQEEAIVFLDIKDQEIRITKGEKERLELWSLNQGASKMFFPSSVEDPEGVWRILEVKDDFMRIEAYGIGSVANNISIIEFQKIKE